MKKIYYFFVALIVLFSFNIRVKALTKYEVSDVTEYFDKIQEISTFSNEQFVIELTGDILISSSSEVKNNNAITNGNEVTIIGNGHSIKCTLDSNCRLKASNGTLILGKQDGTDSLIIEGNGDLSGTSESLVTLSNGNVTMYDGVILQNNLGNGMAVAGAGVYVGENSTFTMEGGLIQNNVSDGPGIGGAIIVNESTSKFIMNGGEIKNNSSTQYGGAIYQEAGTVILNKGKFTNNTSMFGGAIGILGGELNIYDVTFEENSASYYGGAILGYLEYNPTITIDGATFKNNSASYYGGAIMNYGVSNLTIENSTFDGNTSSGGGAIFNYDGSIITSKNKFTNNYAPSGGAIYSQAPLTSSNDIITNNTANTGAGVYLTKSTADLSTTDIYNNKATTKGNDIYITTTAISTSIKDASLMNGYATYDETNVNLKNWFKDDSSNRYSLSNITEAVPTSSITAGTAYSLTASGDAIYIVKFETNGGSRINDDLVEIGGKVSKPTDPTKDGYTFVNWYSDAELNTEYDFDSIVPNDITLYAKWEISDYNIIEGDGQQYQIDKDNDITFKFNAPSSLFENGEKIYIDDQLVDSSNYTSSSSDNSITLKKSYLNSLSAKQHTLKVVFNNGGSANGTFTVLEKASDDKGNINPKTGDNIYAYLMLLALSSFGLVLTRISKKVYDL